MIVTLHKKKVKIYLRDLINCERDTDEVCPGVACNGCVLQRNDRTCLLIADIYDELSQAELQTDIKERLNMLTQSLWEIQEENSNVK